VEWQEEHFVVFVHDVYTHPKHGRVIEFYAEHGGMRIVPLSQLRVTAAGEREIIKALKTGETQ
jgi:hypothetical protein